MDRKGRKVFGVGRTRKDRAQRVVVYGTGGIGKTSLIALAPEPVIFDLQGGADELDIPCINDVHCWQDLMDALSDDTIWNFACQTIGIDDGSTLQQWAIEHTLATVPTEKGKKAHNIDDYGYGKGAGHVCNTFRQLLVALDRHVSAGRNVVIACHETAVMCPNPAGDDFLRYQPLLMQTGQTGRIRDEVKNWCDTLAYIGYDVHVKDGRGQGGGSRTIQVQESPAYLAKSRSLRDAIPYPEGSTEFWDQQQRKAVA